VRDPFAEDAGFRRLIAGDGPVDLARVNLEVARDAYPDLDVDRSLAAIDALAARVRDRCPAGARAHHVVGQINWVLFVEEEFRGNSDEYYDPRNSYLNEVLDRKLGMPIALAILYLALADRVGLAMGGVNLPGHFLARTAGDGPPIFVDPFHAGRILDRAGCERLLSGLVGRPVRLGDGQLAPCDDRTTVSRMLRNLKSIHVDRKDFAPALPVARRLAALNPDDLAEHRDWGMIGLHADRPGEAVAPLARYVAEAPRAPDVEEVRALLRVARREVASRN